MISTDLRKWVGELARAAAPPPGRVQQMINSCPRKRGWGVKTAKSQVSVRCKPIVQIKAAPSTPGRAQQMINSDLRKWVGELKQALVAQLDRASDSDSEGRAFESHQAHQQGRTPAPKPSPITWTRAFHFVWLGAGPGLCLKFASVPLHRKPSPIKTDTYIEILPLSVTKHSGALCIFMLLS